MAGNLFLIIFYLLKNFLFRRESKPAEGKKKKASAPKHAKKYISKRPGSKFGKKPKSGGATGRKRR